MITKFHGERLSVLSHGYAVDGRVSWHDPAVRGFAPMNCYLAREDDSALMIETGLGIHLDAITNELKELLAGTDDFGILVLRLGEFDSAFNMLPLIHTFQPTTVYGQYELPLDWANFRNDCSISGDGTISFRGIDRKFPELETRTMGKRDLISVGKSGHRRMEVFRPELLLLNTHWVFDEETGTLFTSDVFSHVLAAGADGPWVVTKDNDTAAFEDVKNHLLRTRYWWLPGAYYDDLRRDLAGIFERHRIETIAPSYGCVLHGSDVVERHYKMVDQVIAEVGRSASQPREPHVVASEAKH